MTPKTSDLAKFPIEPRDKYFLAEPGIFKYKFEKTWIYKTDRQQQQIFYYECISKKTYIDHKTTEEYTARPSEITVSSYV